MSFYKCTAKTVLMIEKGVKIIIASKFEILNKELSILLPEIWLMEC